MLAHADVLFHHEKAFNRTIRDAASEHLAVGDAVEFESEDGVFHVCSMRYLVAVVKLKIVLVLIIYVGSRPHFPSCITGKPHARYLLIGTL